MGAVEHLKTLCCLGLPPESAMVAVVPVLHEIIPHGWTRLALLAPDATITSSYGEHPASGELMRERLWRFMDDPSALPSLDDYVKNLRGLWEKTGCDPSGAPFVIRGLLTFFDVLGPQQPALATAFLDEAHCPGAHGLLDDDKIRLRAIWDQPASQQPKPVHFKPVWERLVPPSWDR
jgi:hypothetical protein